MSSTLPWLGRPMLALLVVVGLPQSARANFIDLVAQSYLIQGRGIGIGLPSGIIVSVVDYVETSGTPISRHDAVLGEGFPGGFILDTSANGGITPASAFVQAEAHAEDLGSGIAAISEATAAITFRPLVTDLVVQTVEHGSHEFPGCCFAPVNNSISGLFDLTAGATVLAFEGHITPADYNVSLNPGHLYTIYATRA